MSEEETKPVEQEETKPVEQEETKPVEQEEETKPVENKITTPAKKKEKDPKRVAQGKRLAQISERAKREKIRREIEEENKLFDFSVNYSTLLSLGAPVAVFLGLYLYSKNTANTPAQTPTSPPKTKNEKPKHVSLFD